MLGYYKREKFVSNTEIEVPVLTVLANACSALDAYARRPAFVRVDVVPGSVHDTFGDVLDDGIMTIGKSTRLVPLPLPPVSTRTGFDASNSFQHHKNPASNSEMAEYVVQEFLLRILNYNMVVDRIAWEDLFHGLIRLKMEAYGVHLIHDLVGVWLTKIEQQFKLPASSSSDSKMGALQLLQHVQHCIDSLDLNGLSQVLVGSRASAQTTYTLKERGEEKGGKDVTFNSLQVIDEMAKRMIKLDQYLKHGQEQSSTTSNSGAETVLPYKLQQHLGNTITPQYSGIEDRGLKMDLLLVLKNARSDLVS